MAGNVEPRTGELENRRTGEPEYQASSIKHQASRNVLRRLLRLWKLYAVLDFTFLMADLKLALTWYISDGIVNLASVTATLLLADRFAGIGAWGRYEVVFLLGYATTVSGLMNMLFGYN